MVGAGAQSLDVLHHFTGNVDGAQPNSLVEGTDGHFYGTTCTGGLNASGTVFRASKAGEVAVIYAFLGSSDGRCPNGLLQARDGLLYGTSEGGAFDFGTAFRLTLGGAFTVLHHFGEGPDAREPGPLVQAVDGHLYGTSVSGGIANLGTVFRMTLAGEVTLLHAFAGGAAGAAPRTALLQPRDGLFYGSTSAGGAASSGTLFRMTPSGTVTILHAFTAFPPDGVEAPSAPLVEGADGHLYGVTTYRNSFHGSISSCAVVFRVSPGGAFVILAPDSQRCGASGRLYAMLVATRSGRLLGADLSYFPNSNDAIVEVSPAGQINTVREVSLSEGGGPYRLIEAADGDWYGSATSDGAFGRGTIFRLNLRAPTRLTVSSAGGQVRFAWTAVTGADTYTVKRTAAAGGETTVASGVVGTTYVDTTAVRGQTYYYVVTATNAFGESGASHAVSVTPGRAIPGDFDADGRTDLAVYRPSTGVWYIRQSRDGGLTAITWGAPTDVPVPGDYDGDGQIDAAVFRPSTGVWYIRPSTTWVPIVIGWGTPTDLPVPGDYDGDGQTDAAVFRPSTFTWYIRASRTFTALTIPWGFPPATPVPGDYDGDGQTDVAVFNSRQWVVRRSSTFTLAGWVWGGVIDTPVPADYDGDGKVDISVFRPSAHTWYIVQSGSATGATLQWGDPADVPVPGDYDGDGQADLAVFRPSTGTWYIRLTSTGTMLTGVWGVPTDVPVLKRP